MTATKNAAVAGAATPTHYASHATRVIVGEQKAREYLVRLHAEQAGPDELALILAKLYGAELRGFCRVVERAIGGRE